MSLRILLSAVLALAGAAPPVAAFCLHPLAEERLVNYCLLRSMDGKRVKLSYATTVDARLKNAGHTDGLGLGLPYQPRRSSISLAVRPTLEWSPNINGGNPDGPLRLGALTFEGAPGYVRKKGILGGVGLRLGGRYRYGEGRYLDYHLTGNHAHSPQHGIGVSWAGGQLCGIHSLRNWWYADACLNTRQIWTELADRSLYNASLGISKIFSRPDHTYHQASIRLNRLYDDGRYTQNQLALALNSSHANGLFTGLSLLLGERITDELAIRYGITARVGIRLANKPLSLSVAHNRAVGGRLLGFARDETTQAISLSYPVLSKITLSVGYRKTNSKIDYFDISEPVFGIHFPPLHF
ncbi:MAG: hypothetical protein ACR2P9_05245 [Gammaproteobacteria bacterium]